jgi:WD40 repeat protein
LPGTSSYFGLALEPGGRRLLLGIGAELGLLDVAGARPGRWHPLGRHDRDVRAVAVHPAGGLAASGDSRGEIRLWRVPEDPDAVTDAAPMHVLAAHQSGIVDLEFSPDGAWMASAGMDGTVRLWEMPGAVAEPIVLRAGNVRQFTSIAFHPSGRWIATASSSDGMLALWPLARPYPRVFRGHSATTVGIAFDPAGRWLASAAMDGTVRRWPLHAAAEEAATVVHENGGEALFHVSADRSGSSLVVGSNSGTAWLIPLAGGAARPLTGFSSYAPAVVFGPDGGWIAAAGGQNNRSDAVVRIWPAQGDAGSGRVLDPGDGRVIEDINVTPDGLRLVASGGGGLRVWDLRDGAARNLDPEPSLSSDVSGDGSSVVYSRPDGRLRTCSLPDGPCRPLPGEGWSGLAVAVHPGGRLAAAGDSDGTIRFGATDRPPHLLLGHGGFIPILAFHPDGRSLASTSWDRTVRLWPLPDGQPFHLLPPEELLGRLQVLTNLRVVADAEAPAGYRLELAPFPGWQSVPAW